MSSTSAVDEQELDVRGLPKPQKHPTIFATYSALPVGGSFVLINDHDPRHLREEFEVDLPGSFGWEYLRRQPRDWHIRISKLTAAALPRLLADTTALQLQPDAAGAVWKLQVRDRDLDSNVIALPPAGTIDAHDGPDLDVLIHVLDGAGTLTTESGALDLAPGALVWLPRRSRRQFRAGPEGLRYLTVHRRRQALVLESSPSGTDR
jgi:uncharacterized protein (DUF2249 family)/quercetin dioxygenase-like cupin family protein